MKGCEAMEKPPIPPCKDPKNEKKNEANFEIAGPKWDELFNNLTQAHQRRRNRTDFTNEKNPTDDDRSDLEKMMRDFLK